MYYFEKEVEKGFDPKYKVIYPHDEMDYKNPTVKFFEHYNELEDWISEEVQRRVDCIINDRHQCSENELKEIEEYEWYLVRIEKIQSCDVDFYAYKGV